MMIRDKGKSLSYLYSRALVIGLIIFVAALFSFYIYLRLTAPIPLEHVFQPDDNYWSLVKKSEGSLGECKVTEGCYTETELRESKAVVEILGTYLSQHAGKYECNWSGYEERRVASTVARMAIMKLHGNGVQILWKPVLNLLIKNPRWKINVIGEDGKAAQNVNEIWWVESVEAIKPWTCTVANAMSRIITVVVAVFVVGLLGYLAFLYGSYRKRQLQQQDNLFYDLLENTVELLESQHVLSRDDPKEQAYLAIRHVHDTLINPPDRQSMKGVWDRVVKHMKENESRVREEVQQVQGEEHLVWRWLQSTDSKGAARDDGTSRWVGSALRDATRLKLNFTPKQCLKIRGMFDIYKETGTNWPQRIRDDILERLGPDHGVVHLEVDTQSEENRVYMKLGRKKHAGKAYQLLNGAYYGGTGDCVQCKFIELDKYHQKFPLAGSDTAALTQSPPGRSPNLYPSLSRYQ